MSLRSPLGRVVGHGAAKDGVGHWSMQRLTALALVPLTVWFLLSLLSLAAFDYPSVRSWLATGWTPVFLVLLVGALAYHSALGVQVVIEDYVHTNAIKVAALVASTFVHLCAVAAGLFAVLKVALGAV
jgi:succinate dehydrogenase / fumarate reductase, membrane anchor subunit